jgi:hypothetical protein
MEFNDIEKQFLESLKCKFKQNKLNKSITFSRLKDKTISVNYNSYVLGKINLQSENPTMMVHKDLYDHYIVEGNLEIFISEIDKWIKYAKKYLRS